MLDKLGGIPVHALVVHAAVILIMAAAVGTIALAILPGLRHRYGYLLLFVVGGSLVFTWLTVESGQILTAYPGLGSTTHAAQGDRLLLLMIPFVLLTAAMVVLDRIWLVNTNKYGVLYRRAGKREPTALTWQPKVLAATCALAVVMSVGVAVQTTIVGHSGAETTWEHRFEDRPRVG